MRTDVCILGAGMAGLTLALQLRDRAPELSITVLEHRGFPVPTAAHKVGESTVEIAAHYLAEILGLREHLESAHLPKFGLRLFFGGDRPPDDLAGYDEVGASRVLPVPTYQLDRGILENHLAHLARDRAITLLDRTSIRRLDVCAGNHRIEITSHGERQHLGCRFLVDTSGRRAWLRRERKVGRGTGHDNGAVWFRVAGDIDIEQWSADSTWRARCHGRPRRLSTNHFMGPGYWAWVIPLASNATSVGLVYDPALVDAAEVSSHEHVSRWLDREQPLLGRGLDGAEILDFHRMQTYAAGCRHTYSSEGWMLSGDAAVFADPFYSPGGDFIAIGNTFVTELIAAGGESDETAAAYQRYLLSFFANTLSLYRGLYPGFGHRDLMVLKTAWDYAYYWSVLAKLYFSGRMVDRSFMSSVQANLVRAAGLNARMQKLFRQLAAARRRQGGQGGFVDHYRVPWFHALKEDLVKGCPQHAAGSLAGGIDQLDVLARSIGSLLPRVEAGAPLPALETVPGLA